jgi:outer membrane protein TolC
MRNKICVFVVVFCFIFLKESSYAQTTQAPITITNLEQIWKIAFDNNSNLKTFAFKQQQANEDIKATRGTNLPQIGLNFAAQDNLKLSTTPVPGDLIGQPGKTVFLQFGKAYTYNAGLNVTQVIFDWQLRLQNQLAQETSKMIEYQKTQFIQNLKIDIAKNYYSFLIAKASLEISKKDKILADSILQLTSTRFQQGLIDASIVNLANINVNNIKQNVLQTEDLGRHAILNLKLLTGLSSETAIIFQEVLNIESFRGKLLTLEGPDKTLLLYSQSVSFAAMQKKIKQSAYLPKLYANGYTGAQQFRDNFGMGFNSGAWKNYRYIGINMSWSIFSGFSKKANINASVLEMKIAEEQYRNALVQSAINDASLLEDYSSASIMVDNAKSTFKLYSQNLELARQKFEVGLISAEVYCKQFEDYLHTENNFLTQLSNLFLIESILLARKSF